MPERLICRICGGLFPRRISRHGGHQPQFCSPKCRKANLKAYYSKWTAKNRSKIRKQRDANRDQVRKWNREFYYRHRERRKKLRVEQYRANPDKALTAARKYAAEHPELIRKLGRKSSLKRRAIIAKVYVETVDPVVVFERDKGMCGICMKPVDRSQRWEIDHVIPISKGGPHAYSNVQLSHQKCNRAKWDKMPSELT